METLIDDLYEAAFFPDRWTDVLERMCGISGSASASMLLTEGPRLLRWKTTALTFDPLARYVADRRWQHSTRPDKLLTCGMGVHGGWLCANDVMTPQQLAQDPIEQALEPLGVGWQCGTGIELPNGKVTTFTFERRLDRGRHRASEMATLDLLRPHLLRVALLTHRLGDERARSALAALSSLDLPGALLDSQGRLREANALLAPALLDVRGGARVVLNEPCADARLAALLADGARPEAGSFALPARGARPACVAHLVPLADSVRDPFSSGALLLFFSTAGHAGAGCAPDPQVLGTLFDLSPAESRLASALAGGLDLAHAAQAGGIRISTARSYLERVFDKTGCHRQSELVRLLAGVAPMRATGVGAVPVA